MRRLALALALLSLSACTRQSSNDPNEPLPVRGKRVYLANCIACHNPDPTKDGAIGPAIAGSSLELVTARVMEAKYPPGYKPKRQSSAMSPLPQLKDQLDAIQAFLAHPQ
ncbi:MAG: c-type cytochrome [Bdellovibrionota bacterium]